MLDDFIIPTCNGGLGPGQRATAAGENLRQIFLALLLRDAKIVAAVLGLWRAIAALRSGKL